MLKRIFTKIKEYSPVISLFIIWRLGLFVIGYFGYYKITHNPNFIYPENIHPIIGMWSIYDVDWYTKIAEKGYLFNIGAPAFFPLWILFIVVAKKILFFFSIKTVSLILANTISLINCILLYQLVKIEYDKNIAYKSVKYFLFFPMSFFLAMGYSEPLFIFFVLLSFYFMNTKKWATSIFSAMGAAISRIVGITIIVPLLINILKTDLNIQNKLKRIFSLLLIPLGIILYMLYLKHIGYDYLEFLRAHENWQREINVDALNSLLSDIKTIFRFRLLDGYNYANVLIESGSYLFFIVILLTNYKKINLSYLIYSITVITLPLFSGALGSMNRFVIVAFPTYIILALIGSKNKIIDEMITIFFLLGLSLFTCLFVAGWPVG